MSDKSEVYYYSAKELAGLKGMQKTESGVIRSAKNKGYAYRKRQGRGGGKEYLQTDLPKVTQDQLILMQINESIKAHQLILDEKYQPTDQEIAKQENERYQEEQKQRLRTKEENLAKFNTLPDAKKRLAEGKETIIKHYYDFKGKKKLSVGDVMKQFCDSFNAREMQFEDFIYSECLPQKQGKGWLKPASFKRWVYEYQQKGILSLVNNYGKRVSKIETNKELYAFVIGFMIRFPHAGGKRIKEALAADKPELNIIKERSIQRYIKEWREDNAQLWTYIVYPDKWKSVYMSAQGSQHENISFANQLWELDSTPGDWLLKDGRHSVIGVIDMYTRRMLFFVSKTSSADAVCQLFRRAILRWGVPVGVRTDNGKDYVSDRFTLALRELEIHQQLCIPFASEEKGSIERGLQTMSHGLLELETGFIGHNVTDRKMIESRKSFAQRIMTPGEVVEIEMTAADLQTKLDNWNDNVYSKNPHGGLNNRSPFDAANDTNPDLRLISDERALDILLQPIAGTRNVGKKGIRYENREYISDELGEHVGKSALLRYDERDAGSLMVYIDEEFICVAKYAALEGISRQEIAVSAKRKQKEIMVEHTKELKQSSKAVSKDIAEIVMKHRAEDSANVIAFPQKSTEYSSAALEQAANTNKIIDNDGAVNEQEETARAESRKSSVVMLNEYIEVDTYCLNDAEKWRHWNRLNDLSNEGRKLSELEQKFYRDFTTTDVFKCFKSMEDELVINKD